ncbi:putative RAS small monomeric GTPase [Aspergillus saccharolyticus JOP 1030-1]|uniref:Ras small monomeric GTPase n=1 Tax=Aspergillus saccharolyticus JOP 1030-1 TaxID=1450539 RepID=A0A318Z465_9EURO|nr:ras small monomeric GTPase [Aspergillus saccharolyticus JOP 1030-1]PYH41117.1 ras small monomeric GTPase [Aspergillus saccharolyticus JOP 1030-1]
MTESPEKISITICGDGGCGKSSITLRLVRSQWIHEYDPTIEDSYSVTRVVDGVPYFLSITDTAGQEEYRGLWTAANLKSDAFLLVYDITNQSSLHALDYFMDMIEIETEQRAERCHRLRQELGDSAAGLQVGMPPPVKIVAGNKCDLKESRVIGAPQGLEYARRHGCGFMETSAREMVNIEETFALLVRRVVEARQLHYQTTNPSPKLAQSSGLVPEVNSTASTIVHSPSVEPSLKHVAPRKRGLEWLRRRERVHQGQAAKHYDDKPDSNMSSEREKRPKRPAARSWRRIWCF